MMDKVVKVKKKTISRVCQQLSVNISNALMEDVLVIPHNVWNIIIVRMKMIVTTAMFASHMNFTVELCCVLGRTMFVMV